MRILVTGGSGYIGSQFVRALVSDPGVDEVIVLDIRPPADQLAKVRFVERSVTEDLADLVTDAARPVDVVAHLAWVLDPLHDAKRQRDVCIGGTRRVLEACARGHVGHLLFMSSGTAYGANPLHDHPLREFEPLKECYHFQYSAEKREAEFMCRRFKQDYPDTLLQVVRPCVVGGPNVSNFIFRGMDSPFVPVPYGYDPQIQLVHETDVARALVAILGSRVPGAFNVAGDGFMPLKTAYQRVGARTFPLPVPLLQKAVGLLWKFRVRSLIEAPPEFLYFLAYPWLLDNTRLKEEVGFSFNYTTDEVLEDFVTAKNGGVVVPKVEAEAVSAPVAKAQPQAKEASATVSV